MKEFLQEAKEELKRADHLIYVSLKYTRSVDVIRSIIERLISAFDRVIDGLLERAKENGKIDAIPKSPGLKAEKVRKLHGEIEKCQDYVDFYLTLRQILISKFERVGEFRKNVALVAYVDGEKLEINIETITNYYHHSRKLIEYIQEQLKEELAKEPDEF